MWAGEGALGGALGGGWALEGGGGIVVVFASGLWAWSDSVEVVGAGPFWSEDVFFCSPPGSKGDLFSLLAIENAITTTAKVKFE